ncbi:hypothetical protein [Archangium primigenium]|uniref:hypothetical protein n=1 Tax=[Archangium] primigenium TaxID=2792470 RepID=UPI00195847E7|nr:hypothetical protein [Archangium primigenium]MBM7112984.1 hypothetical protein [Archangium primigenium]
MGTQYPSNPAPVCRISHSFPVAQGWVSLHAVVQIRPECRCKHRPDAQPWQFAVLVGLQATTPVSKAFADSLAVGSSMVASGPAFKQALARQHQAHIHKGKALDFIRM